MGWVQQGFASLAELIRSMSAGTRLATLLLLALVVISLGYLWQYRLGAGEEYLLGGRAFTPSELTAIEAAFAKAGLGKSQVVGNQVKIPRGQKELYLAALADASALPADFYKYLDEATAADNPFASTRSLEMRLRNGKQKELALIIRRMRGIEDATVQYDEEVGPGPSRTKQKTAMVAVLTRSPLDEEQIKAIRNVVASAYAGLDRRHITITDMTSGYTYGSVYGPDGLAEDESLYAAHKQRYERWWQQKIQQQLAYIPGVIVGVNAELNPEVQHNTQSVKLDPKPVTVTARESSKEAVTRTPQVAGRPGAVSNGVGNQPVSLQASSGSGPESNVTESRSDVQNVPGHDTTVLQLAALVPKKVTASIDIPASYYVEVWRKRHPPSPDKPASQPDAAELAAIETEIKNSVKEKVRNLLPDVDQGTNPYPHIVVETYTDLPVPTPPPPSLLATTGAWLADHWQTLALLALTLLALGMLRSLVRTPAAPLSTQAASEKSAVSAASPQASDAQEPEEASEPARVLKARFSGSGPDLKQELQEIVKENPDAAATILRAWIGEAA